MRTKLLLACLVLALAGCTSPIAPQDCDDPAACEYQPDPNGLHQYQPDPNG